MVAAHGGFSAFVAVLIAAGADLNIQSVFVRFLSFLLSFLLCQLSLSVSNPLL
jgi:hypothetical protein